MNEDANYVLNVSSIKDYTKCRWRWVAKWVLNRTPREGQQPLQFGKVLHHIFEEHFRTGIPMPDAWVRAYDIVENDKMAADTEDKLLLAGKTLESLIDFGPQIRAWEDKYTFDPALEVEVAFRVQHPDDPTLELRGRPDRHAVCFGRLWHIQNRGLASGSNFTTYTYLAQRDLHENLYAYSAMLKYPDIPYGGTFMNLIRKLKHRGVPTKKEPEGKILHSLESLQWQGPVAIKPAIVRETMANLLYWATEMRETERRFWEFGEWPAPNEGLNGGPYGNSIDPYFRVLIGETTLDDDRYYETRENTYAAEEIGKAA